MTAMYQSAEEIIYIMDNGKMKMKKQVTIYADGACSGNPGPGGYAAILKYGEHEREISGGEDNTTNNRMELMGVIRALELLRESCAVTVYSDSKYVVDAIAKGWAVKWRADGWMRNRREAALNSDLWERLLKLCEKNEISFVWVKGHAQNPLNERCDRLAVAETEKIKRKQIV